MLTNIITIIVLMLVSLLPGCGALGGGTTSPISTEDRLNLLAQRMDRNQDGVLTSKEVRGAGGDYGLWIGLGSVLLGALGVGKAASAGQQAMAAKSAADLAQSHVDDVFDATHVPLGAIKA